MDAGRRHFQAPPTNTHLDVHGWPQHTVAAETKFPLAASSRRLSEFHSEPATVEQRAARCHQSNNVTNHHNELPTDTTQRTRRIFHQLLIVEFIWVNS